MASDKDKDGTAARNLIQRLAAIMAEIDVVPKTGRNQVFNYSYIEQSMVMAVLRPKLAAHGVVLVPRVLGSVQTVGTTQKGGQQITERVSVEFTLVNADDPTDTLVVPWLAEGQDSTDKAINKAIVAAQKWMLMKLFLISDADDPDGGGEETAKPVGHREQSAAPNGQRRQTARGEMAIARVDPRGPALDRMAAEMASETETSAEQPRIRSVDDAKRDLKEACLSVGLPAPASLREVNTLAARYGVNMVGSSAGVTVDGLDRIRAALPDIPVGPLDTEHMTETATLLEALRAACRTLGRDEPRSLAQLNEMATEMGLGSISSWQTATTGWLEALRVGVQRHTTTHAFAGWIAAAADGPTLDQLAGDVVRARAAGTITDTAAEGLLEAVDARGAELAAATLYPPDRQDPHEAAEHSGAQEVEAATAG